MVCQLNKLEPQERTGQPEKLVSLLEILVCISQFMNPFEDQVVQQAIKDITKQSDIQGVAESHVLLKLEHLWQ